MLKAWHLPCPAQVLRCTIIGLRHRIFHRRTGVRARHDHAGACTTPGPQSPAALPGRAMRVNQINGRRLLAAAGMMTAPFPAPRCSLPRVVFDPLIPNSLLPPCRTA